MHLVLETPVRRFAEHQWTGRARQPELRQSVRTRDRGEHVFHRTSNEHAYLGSPPVFTLYAGTQSLEVERYADRGLELYAAQSWFTSPLEKIRRAPLRVGETIALHHLTVEVREVNAEGAPTRVRFTFDRSLDDPNLAFRSWSGREVLQWHPPPVGGHVQLTAAGLF